MFRYPRLLNTTGCVLYKLDLSAQCRSTRAFLEQSNLYSNLYYATIRSVFIISHLIIFSCRSTSVQLRFVFTVTVGCCCGNQAQLL